MGSYSVVPCVRHLMGQPHYIIQLPMLACGKRDAMVMAPPPMPDSAVLSCFYGCLSFLHRHFPPQSCPSHALGQSLHNQQQLLPWDCCTIPKLQLPATAPSRGPVFLSMVCLVVARTVCVILIPLGLLQLTCFTLSLKCFSSVPNNCPDEGIRPLLQFPYLPRAGSVLLTLLFFPLLPSSYQVLCGSIYSFPVIRYSCLLSAGILQTLLFLKVYS